MPLSFQKNIHETRPLNEGFDKSKSFGKGGRKPDKGRGSLSSERLSPSPASQYNLMPLQQSQRAGNLTPEGRLAAQLALNRSDALEHRGMTAGKFVADVLQG